MIARKAMKDEGLTLLTRVTLLYRLFVRFDPGQVPRSDARLDGKSSKMMDASLSFSRSASGRSPILGGGAPLLALQLARIDSY